MSRDILPAEEMAEGIQPSGLLGASLQGLREGLGRLAGADPRRPVPSSGR